MSIFVFKDQQQFMRHSRQTPGQETADLYRGLMSEEYLELVEAWIDHMDVPGDETVAKIADACVDLIYVTVGLLHALGLDPQPLWDEVQRSNIDKIKHPCPTCDTRGMVWSPGYPARAVACAPCRGQGYLYEVRLREDGKVLKPEGWTPPSLLPIVRLMRLERATEAAAAGTPPT